MAEKVVVIGGSGFLGSHISDYLSDEGYAVTIFDKKPSSYLQNSQEFFQGDIMDQNAVEECLRGSKFVYHLAGIADIGRASTKPAETIRLNIQGAVTALDAALKNGVDRFLYASTVYVYSEFGSFYRISKQAAESIIEVYHDKFGLDYTILRYGSLYGPRAQDWNSVSNYVRQALHEGRILFKGSGEEKREYIHVHDAARLSVEALKAKFANRCFTLTGTQVFNTRELLQLICEILGRPVEISYDPKDRNYDHYQLTPYRFTPKRACKLVPTDFIDIGQGILDILQEIYQEYPVDSEEDIVT